MRVFIDARRGRSVESFALNSISFIAALGVFLAAVITTPNSACGQAPASQPPATRPADPSPTSSTTNSPKTTGTNSETDAATNPLLRAGAFAVQTTGGELNEDQLKQLLVGKSLYLRGGYLDNNLEFDEWGRLTGRSLQGSFTLNEIQIEKLRLSKHWLELEGDRYALHFPGATADEDPSSATNKVKITPKKKTVRIYFERERVEAPKKKKRNHAEDASRNQASDAAASSGRSANAISNERSIGPPPSDRRVTTTTSEAHASELLLTALDKVFSYGIDDRMVQSMPDFWKLYFQAAATKQGYKLNYPGVYRQNAVDQKAKLISKLDPPSNEFAQAKEIAGMALYHAVVGSDGKVEKVVVARPIGFGLDENAEQTIQKAVFQPAVKEGKPVPVALDLVVSFRIYSKRTSQPAPQETAGSHAPVLPGPYTVLDNAQTVQQPQPSQPPPPAQSPQ